MAVKAIKVLDNLHLKVKEALINSESFRCEVKIGQIKAPIVGNSQSIGKIGNDELAYFNEQMLIQN